MAHSPEYQHLMNSKQWRVLRRNYLTEHPLCSCCKERGLIVSARCIHHITPIESARTPAEMTNLCFSVSNLRALCYQCHADIHKAERSHSREAHQRRQAERLERFKARLKKTQQPSVNP